MSSATPTVGRTAPVAVEPPVLDQTPFCGLSREMLESRLQAHSGAWRSLVSIRHVADEAVTGFAFLPAQIARVIEQSLPDVHRATMFEALLHEVPESWAPRPWLLAFFDGRDVSAVPRGEVAEDGGPSDPRPTRAVRELCAWLGVTEQEVADLAGFAVRSVANWRQGMRPRPATVRRLYQLHALIEALVSRLGAPGVRQWLREPSGDLGVVREQLLASAEGLATLQDEAADLLYEKPRAVDAMASEPEERAIEEEFGLPPRRDVVRAALRVRRDRERRER